MEEMTSSSDDPTPTGKSIRIAFLHMAPHDDDVQYNLNLLEKLFLQAAELQADLILTPELAVSGYEFYKTLGREWIQAESQPIIEKFSNLARDHQVALVLGCPIYDNRKEKYYNAAIFIDDSGQVLGMHCKILALPGSIEGWSDPGAEIKPVEWRGAKIGLLICADAYKESIAADLAKQGANVLVSLAAWATGEHGPNGEWEKRSKDTGLCFYVCNRTGQGALLNFEGSASIVAVNGRRMIEYADKTPAILTIDVDLDRWLPKNDQFTIGWINSERS